jgi:hypothetical protein
MSASVTPKRKQAAIPTIAADIRLDLIGAPPAY